MDKRKINAVEDIINGGIKAPQSSRQLKPASTIKPKEKKEVTEKVEKVEEEKPKREEKPKMSRQQRIEAREKLGLPVFLKEKKLPPQAFYKFGDKL